MREMKDSGISWINEIPGNWNVEPIKYCYRLVAGATPESTNVDFWDGDIKWITPADFKTKDVFVTGGSRNLTIEGYKSCSTSMLPIGSIVFSKRAPIGTVAITADKLCTNQGCLGLVEMSSRVLNKFYFYVISIYGEVFNLYGSGTTFKEISANTFANIRLPMPPIQEQKRIANFLDAKCTEIDALAADIQTQIETLEQYKRSIISETVIKGLNPDVEMKDSGIEWIKKIPKEWGVNRIKYLFKSTKGLSITKENLIEEGLPVISYGQIHSKMNTGVTVDDDLCRFVSYDYSKYKSSKIEKFDFAFADTSEDYDGCGNCVYKRTDGELYGGYHVVILKSVNKKDNRYFAYLFQTDAWRAQIRTKVSGVKVYSITQKIINEASVIIPPVQEQEAISNFLDTKCSEINEIIMKRKEQLEVLNEYKKSLIYEYVTGKKEVPEI